MTGKFENPEKERLIKLADKLETLQADKNDGRGVSCVRTIVTVLRMGDIEKAKAICLNEGDKISSYPDIKVFLEQEIVQGEFKF